MIRATNFLQMQSYLLAYTIRHTTAKKETITDHWEVFDEYDENEQSPLQQAQNKKNEIAASFEDEDCTSELYSWNICKIAETSEHYATGDNTIPDFTPAAVPAKWDKIEIEAVIEENGSCEVVDAERIDPSFWSLYMRDKKGFAHCIADVPTRSQAESLHDLIMMASGKLKI